VRFRLPRHWELSGIKFLTCILDFDSVCLRFDEIRGSKPDCSTHGVRLPEIYKMCVNCKVVTTC
jgi:hypothetical protein